MKFRQAQITDIDQLQVVRNSVKENILSNPALVTVDHYKMFLTERGKGWVCEDQGLVVGFAIADLQENNIWALFVNPRHECRGIGRRLHDLMLQWYFEQGKEYVWLSTSPNTRAANFYKKMGWTEAGPYGDNEIRLELTRSNWLRR